MDLAGYVINAVLVEGRSVEEVAADHGVSRSWLYELLARYRAEGAEGLKLETRRPRSSPTRVSAEMEEEIVALRKSLAEDGLDAGASTIHYHLQGPPPTKEEGGAVGGHHLAGAEPAGLRRPPAPQAASELLEALSGRSAE